MNIGLNLVGALIFLAPGFMPIIVEHYRSGTVIRRPALSSSSILVLGIVPIFACVAHTLGMCTYAINDRLPRLIEWPWDPDPYPTIIDVISSNRASNASGMQVLMGIVFVTIEALVAYFLIRELAVWTRRKILSSQYGWEAIWPGETMVDALYRIQATDAHRSLLATVEVRAPPRDGKGGWVGPVENVRLDNAEAIVSVALQIPSIFVERATSEFDALDFIDDRAYREIRPEPPYMVVVIPAAEILSIRFSLSEGSDSIPENPNADVLTQAAPHPTPEAAHSKHDLD